MSRSKSKRRQYSPQQKVGILREHFLEKRPVSEICEAHGISPSMFYRCRGPSSRTAPRPSSPRSAPSSVTSPSRWSHSRRSSTTRTASSPPSPRSSSRQKKPLGTLTATWVPYDIRDQIVDFVVHGPGGDHGVPTRAGSIILSLQTPVSSEPALRSSS